MSYYDSVSANGTSFKLPDGSDFITKTTYTVSQSHGVITLIVASCFSLTAVIGLLAAIAMSAFNTRHAKSPNMFVRTNIVAFFISLLVADILQAVGSIMNAQWVRAQAVEAGTLCTAQGMIKHAADVSIAVWSFIIAVYTFLTLVAKMQLKRRLIMWCTLLGGWSAVAAIVIAGPATLNRNQYGPYYGISGEWCWITGEYKVQRIALDYLIMFMSALFSLFLYAVVFYRLRGKILARPPSRIRPTEKERQTHFDSTLAKQMLLYPFAYIITILPIAVARFTVWSGHDVPFDVTIFCDTIYLLFGLVNTVLFVTTRRILPPRSVIPKFLISQPELIETTAAAGNDDPYYAGAPDEDSGNEKSLPAPAAGAAAPNPFSSPADSRSPSPDGANPFSSPEDGLRIAVPRASSFDAVPLTAPVMRWVSSPDASTDSASGSARRAAAHITPMTEDFDDVDDLYFEDTVREGVLPVTHAVPPPPVPSIAPLSIKGKGPAASQSEARGSEPGREEQLDREDSTRSKGKRSVVSATPTALMDYYYTDAPEH